MSVTMALDARHRSSLYQKFVPLLGEDDANALMSEFPASEATELVTKQFLRAELAELRSEMGGLRTEMAALENRMTLRLGGAIGVATAMLGALITVQ
jgi:hypothetical protein